MAATKAPPERRRQAISLPHSLNKILSELRRIVRSVKQNRDSHYMTGLNEHYWGFPDYNVSLP
jgi:hypothetical protein